RADAVIGLRHRRGHFRAQAVPVDARRLGDIAHRDGDVVEPSDHLRPLATGAYTSSTCTWHRGFLPQWTAMAERTAPRTASITASGSVRRARGRDSKVSTAASKAMSAMSS